MDLPSDIAASVGSWDSLTRWERSEVGRAIRRLGWTYAEIMAVIPVAKGTLSGWCRGIALTDSQVMAIKLRTGGQGLPRDTNRKRRLEVERIKQVAAAQVGELLDDPLWVAGLMLYWAEGAKTMPHMIMVNTDPRILRIFCEWVRRYLQPAPEFTLSLHLHEGNNDEAARVWWRSELHLVMATFTKTHVKKAGSGHRKNHLPFGVCRVVVRRSANAFHTTMAWIDALAEELS